MNSLQKEIFLARAVLISLCAGITGLMWDTWWHVAVGRDTFWEPPHFMLYISVAVALLLSVCGWRLTREKIWRNLAIAAALVPLSAPFDDAWHRWFGVENLSTTWIVWSPPHLVLFGTLIASIFLAVPLLKRDSEPIRLLLGSYAWGSILAMSAIVVAPFYPFGPYHIWGFAGASVLSTIFIGILLIAARYNIFGATFAGIIFISLYFLHAASSVASWVVIPPFVNPPPFTIFFSVVAPALLIDFKIAPWWIEGALAGLLYGALLLGFTSSFLPATFQYTNNETAVAVISCTIGGFLAGVLVKMFQSFRLNKA